MVGEIGFPQADPTVLYIDNMSTIKMATNRVLSARSKHIQLREHFIRFKVQDGTFVVLYIKSCDNLADMFTKVLGRLVFLRLRDCMLAKH